MCSASSGKHKAAAHRVRCPMHCSAPAWPMLVRGIACVTAAGDWSGSTLMVGGSSCSRHAAAGSSGKHRKPLLRAESTESRCFARTGKPLLQGAGPSMGARPSLHVVHSTDSRCSRPARCDEMPLSCSWRALKLLLPQTCRSTPHGRRSALNGSSQAARQLQRPGSHAAWQVGTWVGRLWSRTQGCTGPRSKEKANRPKGHTPEE